MEKIWLPHYPAGVPHEVDVAAYASIFDVFTQSCTRYRERPAFASLGARMTYGELDRLSRDFAAYLQTHCGLVKGERLAIMLPNVLQYPVALFGAFRAGLIVVNCNPLYTPRELAHQLKDSGARALVVLENFAHTAQQALGQTAVETVITTGLGDLFPPLKRLATNLAIKYIKKMVPDWHIPDAVNFRRVLSEGRQMALAPVHLSESDLAFLQYTGGTTGVPKGAMLSHGNMVANLQQISAWIGPKFEEGVEVVVTPLPLYHVFALTANLLTFFRWGALNILIANPRDIPALVAELGRQPFTAMTGVNTLFAALLRDPGFASLDMHTLKVAFGGGMPVQRAVAEQWASVTGAHLIEGYGLTEASPLVAGNPLDTEIYTGTVGLPFPSTEIKICDDSGKELALGEVGEIQVRGPQIMQGYWQQTAETANVLSADGWLKTGDMGFMDTQGQIKLTDRKKDMIVVSGFKVFPNEVEEAVITHPGVLEVAAIGVADDRAGEAVMIVVVRSDDSLTAEALIAHCRTQLTGYKVPRHVIFSREPLPKTPVGKILRRLVRSDNQETS